MEHGVTLKDKQKVGERLDVNSKYFGTAFDTVYEIGVKLAHVVWRKFQPEDRAKADRNLNGIAYDLIEEGRYKLAITVLDFSTQTLKSHANDELRRTLIINRAQAYKWDGQKEVASQIVKSEDWSASSNVFKLAEATLLDEYDKVYLDC